MLNFVIRRLAFMVVCLAAISMLAFALIELPPGTALDTKIQQLRQSGGDISDEQIRALEERYGLRDPLHLRYIKWVTRAARGDFGQSFSMDQPVAVLIWSRLWFSLLLSSFALLFSWGVSIPLGVYSATHRYTLPDYAIQVVQFVGVAIPQFLFALILMVGASRSFGLEVGTLFSKQNVDAPWSGAKLADFLQHVWIPIVVLIASGTAGLTRIMRANLLDVLGQQYVQTARSKGLDERVVIWKHAVRNALHPLIMALGTTLPALISGELIISIVLNLPTTGPIYVRALLQQDMHLGIAILLMLSVMLLIGNLLADLLLAWVDPRVRLE
ncbi:MAG TPA: ABC transporter permease [Chloroflexota bacterium]|nr:ABC transporter permease [Chloroflexota bacterium]